MSKASIYFNVDAVNGMHDVRELKRGLDSLPGVFSVSVNAGTGRVAVDFDTTGADTKSIERQLESLGYRILRAKTDGHVM